jgi:hypothetical protein
MLASLKNDAAASVPKLLTGLGARNLAPADALAGTVRLCNAFRVLAVGALLVDGNAEAFFLHLVRSAENWRRYLRARRDKAWPLVTPAMTMPIFGAVVAETWTVAEEIGQLSAADVKDEHDYADEHLFARLVATVIASRGAPTDHGVALLSELEALGQPAYEHRIAVVRSLLDRDAASFERAFAEAALQFNDDAQKRSKMISVPASQKAVESHLWLEGLAWLRLGEKLGMPAADTYLACPSLGRRPNTARYNGDFAVVFA